MQDLDHKEWEMLVGTWSREASHRLLVGDEIGGEMTFEWLDGHRLLIQRSRHDHPNIRMRPQSSASPMIRLSVHYYDFSGDANTTTGQAELSPDRTAWENDLAISHRRVG